MSKYEEIICNIIKELNSAKFFVIKNLCKKIDKWGEKRYVNFILKICKRKTKKNPEFYCPLDNNDCVIFY